MSDGPTDAARAAEAAEKAKAEDALAVQADNDTVLAVSNADFDDAFGGPDVNVPIEVSWPEIKMSKSDFFEMPDKSKPQELVGYLVFTQRSRAYWDHDYDPTQVDPPNCASSNGVTPDSDGQHEAEMCSACDQSQWCTVQKDGKDKNVMPCAQSLNAFILLDGMLIPRYLRIRSTSMSKKSSIASFFTACGDPGYALREKYQTVKVKLTLEETTISSFATSILIVEKMSTIEATDPLLAVLAKTAKAVAKDFVVKHVDAEVVNPADDDDDVPDFGADVADDQVI